MTFTYELDLYGGQGEPSCKRSTSNVT